MKIQLACDFYCLEDALKVLKEIVEEIDIIEVGTDLMLAEGTRALRIIKETYPDKILLSDMKVMDGGRELGELAYKNGADIFTVLGLASEETIQAACSVARQYHKKVCVDMIGLADNLEKAKQYSQWGADYLCVHTADDQLHNKNFYHCLADYVNAIGACSCSIAGGINPDNLKSICKYEPEIIVVGGYITRAANPKQALKDIKEVMYG